MKEKKRIGHDDRINIQAAIAKGGRWPKPPSSSPSPGPRSTARSWATSPTGTAGIPAPIAKRDAPDPKDHPTKTAGAPFSRQGDAGAGSPGPIAATDARRPNSAPAGSDTTTASTRTRCPPGGGTSRGFTKAYPTGRSRKWIPSSRKGS